MKPLECMFNYILWLWPTWTFSWKGLWDVQFYEPSFFFPSFLHAFLKVNVLACNKFLHCGQIFFIVSWWLFLYWIIVIYFQNVSEIISDSFWLLGILGGWNLKLEMLCFPNQLYSYLVIDLKNDHNAFLEFSWSQLKNKI